MFESGSKFRLPWIALSYIIMAGALNFLYIFILIAITSNNYWSLTFKPEKIVFAMTQEIAMNMFYSLIDIQTLFYLMVSGTSSFFYVYVTQILCKHIQFVVFEGFVFNEYFTFLHILSSVCIILRIIVGVIWMRKIRLFLFKRTRAVLDGFVQNNSYTGIYYMLQGCSLNLMAKGVFLMYFIISNRKKELQHIKDGINSGITAITAYFIWYMLWIEKRRMGRKKTVIFFIILNILRFFSIFAITGERRYIINIVVRGKSVIEIFTHTYLPEKINSSSRNYLMFAIDNLEKFFIDITYNIYFIRYCFIVLWSSNELSDIKKGRILIEHNEKEKRSA